VPAFEPVKAWRIVATPTALDAYVAPADSLPLRIAPDDLLLVGDVNDPPAVDDTHAIVVEDRGWSTVQLSWGEVNAKVQPITEWHLPHHGPMLAQGSVGFVASKLWITEAGVRLFCQTAYAHELEERLA
jgi:hypothetical protein